MCFNRGKGENQPYPCGIRKRSTIFIGAVSSNLAQGMAAAKKFELSL